MIVSAAAAQSFTAPAGIRPAYRRAHASILPGGRIVAPLGQEYGTRGSPFGLAVSASGNTVATANIGPWLAAITILDRARNGQWESRNISAHTVGAPFEEFAPADWHSVSIGVACSGDRGVYVSEGESGRVSYFDGADERRRVFDLNQGGYADSYSGDLALDLSRNVLYVADQANARVAVFDTRTRQLTASVKVGPLPFAMTLSPDRQKLYITNAGTFQYRPLPDVDPSNLAASGLVFPAFGFPSAEAVSGARRKTGRGPIDVPGLGDPNAREADSLAVVDVSNPASPRVQAFVRTGKPIGGDVVGGSSPSGVLAAAGRVFVSNATDDSVAVIDAKTNAVISEIPIRISGLEGLRGVLPLGMAYVESSGWLLVAEAGINAVGVIDATHGRVLGHLPAAWYPTRVALDGDTVLVANTRGHGQGPSGPGMYLPGQLYQGTVSLFTLPKPDELAADTALVMQANGFIPGATAPPPLPAEIRHVVLIVKESRSYDEILGDILSASNGPAMGLPSLARLGEHGAVDGKHVRISIRDTNLTPNQHAMAREWAFSDNFYSDADGSVDGHHWLAGVYPNGWAESSLLSAYGGNKDFRLGAAPGRLAFAGTAASVQPEDEPEAGGIWEHFARHGISFYNFGEGFELAGVAEGSGLAPTGARFVTNMPMPEALYRSSSRQYPGFNIHISDQYRANQLIQELNEKYVKTGADLPQFIYIHLPGDFMPPARPEDGYPYEESFVVDNDYALGRIVEYFSHSKWWNQTALFVTEDDAEGGADHIDAHRTILLCAGPWIKHDYVSHENVSFPGLLKTIFRLLGAPPLNLFDAAAAGLEDCFARGAVSSEPFQAIKPDKRIFDPSLLRAPADSSQPKQGASRP